MVYEKFYNLLGIGDLRGRGGCFVYPEINFADVFRKVYAGTGDNECGRFSVYVYC